MRRVRGKATYWNGMTMTDEQIENDYAVALHDLLLCIAEQRAIGGGPGWQERYEKALASAWELFEP